jgi:hypothetical protein
MARVCEWRCGAEVDRAGSEGVPGSCPAFYVPSAAGLCVPSALPSSCRGLSRVGARRRCSSPPRRPTDVHGPPVRPNAGVPVAGTGPHPVQPRYNQGQHAGGHDGHRLQGHALWTPPAGAVSQRRSAWGTRTRAAGAYAPLDRRSTRAAALASTRAACRPGGGARPDSTSRGSSRIGGRPRRGCGMRLMATVLPPHPAGSAHRFLRPFPPAPARVGLARIRGCRPGLAWPGSAAVGPGWLGPARIRRGGCPSPTALYQSAPLVRLGCVPPPRPSPLTHTRTRV